MDGLALLTDGMVVTVTTGSAVITVTQELKAVLEEEQVLKAVLTDDN